MAESSDNHPQVQPLAEEPDEPQGNAVGPSAETDARLEATELARLRQNYSRHSHASNPNRPDSVTKKPSTLLEHCIYAVKRTWRHQISITVDHDTCRDHLVVYNTRRIQAQSSASMYWGNHYLVSVKEQQSVP
ncbi:hypothetical protein EG329_009428 [Mollisiaceae sp. DMI_Dod_QoI]|nr:hypothetical protein EG329_009428 [Helotiales sp. DMI_Dod_QoI]